MKRGDFKNKISEIVQSGLRGIYQNILAKSKSLPDGSIKIPEKTVNHWRKVLSSTYYKAPPGEKKWSKLVAGEIIDMMTKVKRSQTKSPPDPRVTEVKELFIKYCENIKGFTPEINHGMEGMMIKQVLKKYSVDEITDLFDWFMNSERYSGFSCSLKTILSIGIINSWLKERG